MNLTPGEIADRLSIAEIRSIETGSIQDDLADLKSAWAQYNDIDHYEQLKKINHLAWFHVEQIYRDFDCLGLGDNSWILSNIEQAQACIRNCKRAHVLNKRRIEIKNKINQKFGFPTEKKSWKPSPYSMT